MWDPPVLLPKKSPSPAVFLDPSPKNISSCPSLLLELASRGDGEEVQRSGGDRGWWPRAAWRSPAATLRTARRQPRAVCHGELERD
jgi:hypothetical protein